MVIETYESNISRNKEENLRNVDWFQISIMMNWISCFFQQFATPDQKNNISQIDGPTPKNSFGFQISQQNFQDAKALHEVQKYCLVS